MAALGPDGVSMNNASSLANASSAVALTQSVGASLGVAAHAFTVSVVGIVVVCVPAVIVLFVVVRRRRSLRRRPYRSRYRIAAAIASPLPVCRNFPWQF